MADQDINIRVNTSQTGPGLQPTIKEVEKLTQATKDLTKAQEESRKVGASIPLTGSSGLASAPTSLSGVAETAMRSKRAQELADMVADSRHKDELLAAKAAAKEAAKAATTTDPEAVVSGGLRTALRQGAQVAGLQGVGRALASLAGPLGIVVAGFAAVAGVVKLAWDSLKRFATVQTEIRSLNQTLAASGQFSQGLSASIQELAQAREKNTGIDDSKWIGSFKELIRAGADASALPQLSVDLENLTAVTGDLGSASKLMAGALHNEFSGFKELGIYLDESGSRAQKLAQLTSQLSRETGILASGQDDASAKSSQLSQEFGHVKTQAGQMLSSLVLNNRTIGLTGGILNTLSGWLGKTVTATKGLSESTSGLKPIFVDEAKLIHGVVEELRDEQKLLNAISAAADRKIAKDKATTQSKLGMLEAEKRYKESLIDDRMNDGKNGRPGGIDQFTGTKLKGELNQQYAIRAARLEKGQELKEIAERQKVADATKESMLQAARDSQGKDAALNSGYEQDKQINAQEAAIRGRIAKLKGRRDSIEGSTDFAITGSMPSVQDIAASQKRKADGEAEKKRIDEQIAAESAKISPLEKSRPNIPQLEAESKGGKEQVNEAVKLYKDQEKELIEIERLKAETAANDIRRAMSLAQITHDSKAANRSAMDEVVADFKDGKTKKLPSGATENDFKIDPNIRRQEIIAESRITGVAVKQKSLNQASEIARRQDVSANGLDQALGSALSKGLDPSNSKAVAKAAGQLQSTLDKNFGDLLRITDGINKNAQDDRKEIQRQLDQLKGQLKNIRPQM